MGTRFSVDCGTVAFWLQPCHSQLTLYVRSIHNSVCVVPPKDEQVMLKTCRGPWFSINWIKGVSRWFHYTDVLWCTVNKTLSKLFILSIIDYHYALIITPYSIRRLLHVSASMCHLKGVFYVLMSYLKAELVMLFVMSCECWWSVCTGCCSFVCYVAQMSAYLCIE
jgi:hypothetical protein